LGAGQGREKERDRKREIERELTFTSFIVFSEWMDLHRDRLLPLQKGLRV
jgi:hypothetical protein